MKKRIFLLLFGLITFSAIAQKDASNCTDHPLISRFPAAVIGWCETQNFGEYHIATGPETGYRHIDKWLDVEGKIQRIYYVVKDGSTMSEVYQNYRNSIQRAGFEVLAQGLHPQRNVKKEVGGTSWMGTAFAKNPFPTNSGVQLFHGSSDSGGMGYVAGKLSRPSGNAYVVLAAYQHRADETVVALDIIEEAPLADGKITVDADYIAREMEANGTVALYGIFFDFDKADIKPESKPDLDAVADYLKKYPDVSLYIVGHTDMTGTFSYNLTLSEKRAQAVVEALVKEYGISRERLEGKGVGPLSPKSHNRDDVGRKLNRRVELVKK